MTPRVGSIVLEVAAVAVLLLSMRRAFFGPAPEEVDRVAAAGWMLAGVLLMATAVVSTDTAGIRLALNGLAIEAMCVAGWWLRGRDDEEGGEPAGDPPPDWDEFDRLRRDWTSGPPRDRLPVA